MPERGLWPGHKIQLGAYLLLLEEKANKPIEEGFVRYLDSNETRQLTMNPFLRGEIIELIGKVNTLLKAKELPIEARKQRIRRSFLCQRDLHPPNLRCVSWSYHPPERLRQQLMSKAYA